MSIKESKNLASEFSIPLPQRDATRKDQFKTKQALDEIRVRSGSLYDPDVVDACLRLFNEKEQR
jgi:response regulator RpfG family c-di-GMP phosphodiesterase